MGTKIGICRQMLLEPCRLAWAGCGSSPQRLSAVRALIQLLFFAVYDFQ